MKMIGNRLLTNTDASHTSPLNDAGGCLHFIDASTDDFDDGHDFDFDFEDAEVKCF